MSGKTFITQIQAIWSRNTVLLSNFSYLSALQIATLLLPLITYPYLIRVLGEELYGLVVFTQVVAGYFGVFISFGFSMLGVQEVSIYRENKKKLSEIVSVITFTKSVCLLFSFVIIFAYLNLFNVQYKWLFALAFWVCLLDIVFPTWFFQGIEKMKFITIISLINKILFTILIFIVIKERNDVLWLPISNIVGTIVSGWLSFHLLRKEGVKFVFPTLQITWKYIQKSYHFFLSNVLIQIYANSNKAVVGYFLGMGAVAHYDLAEKIVNLIKIPQTLISQTVYPRVSADRNPFFVKKIFTLSIVVNLGLYLLLFLGAEYAVLLLGGEKMLPAVPIVRILGLLAPIVAISNVMGILTLVPFGYKKLFSQMIGISMISYLLMFAVIWGMNNINLYSLSAINVLVEIMVSVISVYFVYKSNILWKRNTTTS